jgi:2-dehydro-3-deoxygluconokinase
VSKVLCFGELLLRLSPRLNKEWIQQASMPVYVGGAELNVATALAKWNVPVKYVTALPDHYLSKEITESLKEKNIDVENIVVIQEGGRIGTYYIPQGSDLKNAGVIYDREHSAFSEIQPGQLDWEKILMDVSWLHFSAINPALNKNIAAVCKEVLQVASSKKITISVDLNYRSKLWQWGKQPEEVMPELVGYCNIVMGNIWATEKMLGIEIDPRMKREKEDLLKQSQKSSEAIRKQFTKCRQVANTFRFDEGDGLNYYATLSDGNQFLVSEEHQTSFTVDKVGSGDTFMAGLIYGNYNNLAAQETINFAASAAFNKLFIKGDATTSTVEDIRKGYKQYG